MKYLVLLIAWLFGLCLPCAGQKQGKERLDSLLLELPKAKADTNQVKLLNDISFAYSSLSPDSGLAYSQKALAQAQQLNWKKGTGWAYNNMGVSYARRSAYDTDLKYKTKALQIHRQVNDPMGVATSLTNIGLNYLFVNNLPKALDHLFQAIQVFEAHNRPDRVAALSSNIALVYTQTGDYEKALSYNQKALSHHLKTGSKAQQARVLGNMGIVYHMQKNYPKAIEHIARALEMYEALGDKNSIAINLINLGSGYSKLADYPKSYTATTRALALFQELGSTRNIAACKANLGELYFLAASQTQIPAGKLPPYNLGRRQQLQKAEQFLTEAIDLSKEIPDLDNVKNAAEDLAEVQQLLGKPAQALQTYKLYVASRDSLFTQEHKNQIAGLEAKRETELKQKELEIERLKLQKAESQRWYWAGASVLLLLLLGLLYNRFRLKQRKNQELETAYTNLERVQHELLQKEKSLFAKQLLELELKALRAQMNPHFIFNCLNAIQAIILSEDKQAATEYLQKFSRLIRLILDNSRKESTTLEDETEILTLYLDLEQLRMSNRFEYEIDIPEEVESAFTEFPSMVIQPLVENSIWHGLMPSEQQGRLRISFRREEDLLTCVVEDNGIGRQRSQELKGQTRHHSKGLKLIEERLQAWSKTRELDCRIRVLDTPNFGSGTRTEITIQYAPVYA